MRKNVAIALLAIGLSLFSQFAMAVQPGCISVNVSDDTSKPVNLAVISVDGIPRGMVSNSQATLNYIAPGTHVVTVSYKRGIIPYFGRTSTYVQGGLCASANIQARPWIWR